MSDIDFRRKRIKVDHQLQRANNMEYTIQPPKTESGIRYVPMTDEVVACFKKIIKERQSPKIEPMIEGKTGFLYLDKNNMPMVVNVNRKLGQITIY